MPLYEYKCKKCGRKTEKIRKFSDPPLTVCESCGGEIEQLLSSPAIQFKGTGWYVTDYARKSSSDNASSSGGDSSSSSDKKETEKKETEKTEKKEKEAPKPTEPVKASSTKE